MEQNYKLVVKNTFLDFEFVSPDLASAAVDAEEIDQKPLVRSSSSPAILRRSVVPLDDTGSETLTQEILSKLTQDNCVDDERMGQVDVHSVACGGDGNADLPKEGSSCESTDVHSDSEQSSDSCQTSGGVTMACLELTIATNKKEPGFEVFDVEHCPWAGSGLGLFPCTESPRTGEPTLSAKSDERACCPGETTLAAQGDQRYSCAGSRLKLAWCRAPDTMGNADVTFEQIRATMQHMDLPLDMYFKSDQLFTRWLVRQERGPVTPWCALITGWREAKPCAAAIAAARLGDCRGLRYDRLREPLAPLRAGAVPEANVGVAILTMIVVVLPDKVRKAQSWASHTAGVAGLDIHIVWDTDSFRDKVEQLLAAPNEPLGDNHPQTRELLNHHGQQQDELPDHQSPLVHRPQTSMELLHHCRQEELQHVVSIQDDAAPAQQQPRVDHPHMAMKPARHRGITRREKEQSWWTGRNKKQVISLKDLTLSNPNPYYGCQ
jgi:hypothetical protein